MISQQMIGSINQILNLTLGIDEALDKDIEKSHFQQWDSLKSIEVMLMLEEKFNINFREADLAKLNSTFQIAEVLQTYES